MRALDNATAAWRLAPQLDELDAMAAAVAGYARALNGLPPAAPRGDTPVQELRTACTLLERAVRERDEAVVDGSVAIDAEELEAAAVPDEAAPVPDEAADADADPPAAMVELIALRDMVLVAAGGQAGPARATLELIDAKLGQALGRMGVEAIEDTGALDVARQEVVDVRPTGDPAQADQVCATVRPGYAIGDRVVRAQQVSVYRLAGEG